MIRSDGRVTALVCDKKGCDKVFRTYAGVRDAKIKAELEGWDCGDRHYCYLHKTVVM